MSDQEWLSRTSLLMGNEKLMRLSRSHVAVIGLGGVGAYAAEQICRAGVGKMTIVDGDVVQSSNRNRQLPALCSTEGSYKADIIASRIRDINPDIHLTVVRDYLKEEKITKLLDQGFDFVIDAIDTLGPKVHLVVETLKRNISLVSSMGAGGKMDPTMVRVEDVSKSHHCRLAYYIRKRLHRLGIHTGFQVVYSPEPVNPSAIRETFTDPNKRSVVGTISYLPAIFGCYCASVAIRELIRDVREPRFTAYNELINHPSPDHIKT